MQHFIRKGLIVHCTSKNHRPDHRRPGSNRRGPPVRCANIRQGLLHTINLRSKPCRHGRLCRRFLVSDVRGASGHGTAIGGIVPVPGHKIGIQKCTEITARPCIAGQDMGDGLGNQIIL